MSPIQEQFSEMTRAGVEAQMTAMLEMASSTMSGMEKLFDLNLNAMRASIEESAAVARVLMDLKDPQQLLSLTAAQAKPNAEKMLAYSRHLVNIASSTQEEFGKATQNRINKANRNMTKLMENASKNAPAGSENVAAIVKTAIDNASVGYEQLNRSTKQAAEAIEATMSAAVNQLAQKPAAASHSA